MACQQLLKVLLSVHVALTFKSHWQRQSFVLHHDSSVCCADPDDDHDRCAGNTYKHHESFLGKTGCLQPFLANK